MLYWIPPAAAVVLTIVFLYMSEPRPVSKIIVVGITAIALYLQFASGSIGGWVAGLLLNVGVALFN
jgi:hypothetical protein